MKYTILIERENQLLVDLIQEFANKGWECVGGPFMQGDKMRQLMSLGMTEF